MTSKVKRNLKIGVIVASVAVVLFLAIFIPFVVKLKGKPNTETWAKTDKFDINNTVIIEKEKGKDFVILNMTDIQFNDTMDIGKREHAIETMKTVVERVKPDLITMTGDQVWASPFTRGSIKELIQVMDGFKIPWAPVMGNHDGDGNADFMWMADRYVESEYCVFQKGPNNIEGVGNYAINIQEDGKIVHTLVMLDSGSSIYYEEFDKKGYDYIKEPKQDWYEWVINGVKEHNGGEMVESSLFFHIALPEFQTAYDEWKASGKDASYQGFGDNLEDACCGLRNGGFFERIKSVGSTKNIVIGHDHINSSSIMYQGIRLTYGLKTGDRCYYDESMNGGTVLTLNDNGVTTRHEYVKI